MKQEPFADIKARNASDYLLRSTQQHHIQLSTMADQKASMLLGISAIILTLIFNNLKDGPPALWMMLLGPCILLAAIFALVAVMPAVKGFAWRTPNWLFFSTFAALDEDAYGAKMAEILKDDASVYHALTNEIYQLGIVLHSKKYKYLNYSYRTFLFGIIIASLSVVVEMLLK